MGSVGECFSCGKQEHIVFVLICIYIEMGTFIDTYEYIHVCVHGYVCVQFLCRRTYDSIYHCMGLEVLIIPHIHIL